jgi:hypothetical protein
MPFKKGNPYGGKRPGAGRPTKEKQEIKKQAAEIAKEFIETHVQKFLDSYLRLSTGKFIDPATVRHAIDKILPDEQMEHNQPIEIVFQDFARPSKPITGLGGYGTDRARNLPAPADPCRLPLPAPVAEEKMEIDHPQVTFHDFSNGNRSKCEK